MTRIEILRDRKLVKKGQVYSLFHTKDRKIIIILNDNKILEINRYLHLKDYKILD